MNSKETIINEVRTKSIKEYTLPVHVDGLYQGKYVSHTNVIGDKRICHRQLVDQPASEVVGRL